MNIRHWVNDGLMSLLTDLGSETLAIGIILVLVVGKAVGIPLFCWLTLRFNLGRLPSDMSMQHVVRPGLSGTFG
jgi:NhaA family Na+:H+ antiporter